MTVTVETSIDRALGQRPDLMRRVADVRAAHAELKAAKTAYLPTLSLGGTAGLNKNVSSQDQAAGVYSPIKSSGVPN